MANLGRFVFAAFVALTAMACTTTRDSGQGGGFAGSGAQAAVSPPGMTAAQGAAYCTKLAQTYTEYVGSVTGALGGTSRGGQAADLDARVAIAQCQDGNYAGGIPTLQQKLRDARVAVPPPPV